VAEWSKALAWKVSIRQKRIEGSNPSRSARAYFCTVSHELLRTIESGGLPRFYMGFAFAGVRSKSWIAVQN
jgi:hypothetical protein